MRGSVAFHQLLAYQRLYLLNCDGAVLPGGVKAPKGGYLLFVQIQLVTGFRLELSVAHETPL